MNRCLSLLQGTRLLAFMGQKLYILRRQQIIFRPEKTYLNCGVCVHSSEFSHSILLSLVNVENSKYFSNTLYSAASSWGVWICLWLELEQWKSKQGVQGNSEGCGQHLSGRGEWHPQWKGLPWIWVPLTSTFLDSQIWHWAAVGDWWWWKKPPPICHHHHCIRW